MTSLHLSWQPLTLDLKTTFRIAHGASDRRHNLLAFVDGGVGEAAVVPYYGETQEGVIAYFEHIQNQLGDDPFLLEDILNRLPPGSRAARSAIDIALHDLLGQRLGQPLYRLLGLNPQAIPPTSFTIGIAEPDVMARQAKESGYSHLKIKLGSQNDEARLAAIREATQARLRVDANAGWTFPQAVRLIPRLVDFDLDFIEQPLPTGDLEGLRQLRAELKAQKVAIPIFVDENVRSARDVAAHAGLVEGVVIKLMKCGGIRAALRAIAVARALDMQVMLSCMVESSVNVTAAAHLAALADYVDLDSPLLIRNDPYRGIQYQGDRILLPDRPGLGLVKS
jgi:L-alanine-DL-glutamate epimerase-like enolase superfamily enzyme